MTELFKFDRWTQSAENYPKLKCHFETNHLISRVFIDLCFILKVFTELRGMPFEYM